MVQSRFNADNTMCIFDWHNSIIMFLSDDAMSAVDGGDVEASTAIAEAPPRGN